VASIHGRCEFGWHEYVRRQLRQERSFLGCIDEDTIQPSDKDSSGIRDDETVELKPLLGPRGQPARQSKRKLRRKLTT
jgi:hypothetical protein